EQAAEAALGIRMAAPISKAAAEANFIVKTPQESKKESETTRLNQPLLCRQTWAICGQHGLGILPEKSASGIFPMPNNGCFSMDYR
ncbi:MAG TPA: hypothetical protein VEV64_01090, partial [Rhizomicrobium sp.]|nr:hypothetical protein [Rhizomicrobium sp.]